jgi:protein-tyrosine-phosphatase
MAEGFAKFLGQDCREVFSAGTNPAPIVQDETHETMRKRGIVLQGQFPKGIELWSRQPFDIVVNMSGHLLPRMNAVRVIEWRVRDPIGRPEAVYEAVADQIEALVTGLVAELRG